MIMATNGNLMIDPETQNIKKANLKEKSDMI